VENFVPINAPNRVRLIVWRPAALAGLVLLLLRPGVDEALVQRHRMLGGDALGVLA